jgi:hypothetical protein
MKRLIGAILVGIVVNIALAFFTALVFHLPSGSGLSTAVNAVAFVLSIAAGVYYYKQGNKQAGEIIRHSSSSGGRNKEIEESNQSIPPAALADSPKNSFTTDSVVIE